MHMKLASVCWFSSFGNIHKNDQKKMSSFSWKYQKAGVEVVNSYDVLAVVFQEFPLLLFPFQQNQ